MKSAIVVFPGTNREKDVAAALEKASGHDPVMVWHKDANLPKVDLVVVPGGFSYGDYLRSGAMAAQSSVMTAVKDHAKRGGAVLGICNGFQIVTEAGLLPGALMRNASLKFICRFVTMRVENTDSPFTKKYQSKQVIRIPIAHNEGNYFTDPETLKKLEDQGRVVLRYCDALGETGDGRDRNPNGAQHSIAGIISENRRVMGLMPHPENAIDALHGGTDGKPLFDSIVEFLA